VKQTLQTVKSLSLEY